MPSFLYARHQKDNADGGLKRGEADLRLLCRFEDPCSDFSPISNEKRLHVLHLLRTKLYGVDRMCVIKELDEQTIQGVTLLCYQGDQWELAARAARLSYLPWYDIPRCGDTLRSSNDKPDIYGRPSSSIEVFSTYDSCSIIVNSTPLTGITRTLRDGSNQAQSSLECRPGRRLWQPQMRSR